MVVFHSYVNIYQRVCDGTWPRFRGYGHNPYDLLFTHDAFSGVAPIIQADIGAIGILQCVPAMSDPSTCQEYARLCGCIALQCNVYI